MSLQMAIAIDGPYGAGKSSLARRCAEQQGFLYVDTGAIYRTLGLAVLNAGIDRRDEAAVMELLPKLQVELKYNEEGEQRMFLNGQDVSDRIRLPEISLAASDVSAHGRVREYLLEMQRRLAREYNVIMDGRDIGTVVLPDAELKVFLTASPEARAQRRLLQLKEKGTEVSFEEVLKDIRYRDEQDSTRAAAPLRRAEDAVLLDTSDLSFDESYQVLCDLIAKRREELEA